MGFDRVFSKPGTWQVTRLCCTLRDLDHAGRSSCERCRAFRKRQRIMHVQNVSKHSAELIAEQWRAHKAKAMPMKADV